jgi:hypothetical protein
MSEGLTPDTKYVAYKANLGSLVKKRMGLVAGNVLRTCGLLGRKAIGRAKVRSAITASGISVNMDMLKLA